MGYCTIQDRYQYFQQKETQPENNIKFDDMNLVSASVAALQPCSTHTNKTAVFMIHVYPHFIDK